MVPATLTGVLAGIPAARFGSGPVLLAANLLRAAGAIGCAIGLAVGAPAAIVFMSAAVVASAGALVRPVQSTRRTVARRPGPALVIVGFFSQVLVRGMLIALIVVTSIELLDLGDAGIGWLNAAIGLGGLIGAIGAALRGPGSAGWSSSRWSPEGRLTILRHVPLFAPLNLSVLERLASCMVPLEVAAGDILMREGDVGDRYLVVERGAVEVSAAGSAFASAGRATGSVRSPCSETSPEPRLSSRPRRPACYRSIRSRSGPR